MIFPLKEPCPGKCLVIAMSRIELRSSEYLIRFAFLCALGFSGLALKVAGVFEFRSEEIRRRLIRMRRTLALLVHLLMESLVACFFALLLE